MAVDVVVKTISSERASGDGAAAVVKATSSERSAADITAVVKATSRATCRERAAGDAVVVGEIISSKRTAVDGPVVEVGNGTYITTPNRMFTNRGAYIDLAAARCIY